jgi:hypothetical protein
MSQGDFDGELPDVRAAEHSEAEKRRSPLVSALRVSRKQSTPGSQRQTASELLRTDGRDAGKDETMTEPYIANLANLPGHMQESIRAYIETGHPIGHFLTALLSNDLMGAFNRADDTNIEAMRRWVVYLYNYAPGGCYGSPEKVAAWQGHSGLAGQRAA